MADFQDSNFYMCMPTLETFRPSRLVCTYIPGDYYFFFFGDDVQYTLTGESIIERQLLLSPCDTNYDNSPYKNLDLSGRGFSWAGDW